MDRFVGTNRRKRRTYMNMRTVARSAFAAGLIVLGLGMGRKAEASPNPDTMLVSVTPGNFAYGVVISSPLTYGATGYDFQTVNLGATTMSTIAIVVKSSGTIAEFFGVAISNSIQDGWTPVASAPGYDQFEMQALFNGAGGEPLSGSFGAALGTSPPGTASGTFGQGAVKIAPGNTQNLWLQLTMPSSVASQKPQTMVLSIDGQNL
jgi:hypothetical protein